MHKEDLIVPSDSILNERKNKMHINSVNANNTNFGTLHIKPTVTNKLAIEKFLVKNPEALKEFFSEIDRESGDKDVYLHSGNFDSGNIDIAILDKAGNLYGVKSIGLGSPENIQRSFEKFINSFTRKTLLKEPEKPAENKDMNKILNTYA
ncbi:MAG: hypothetical protein OSJ27_03185 [Candidatus Gastranaerophilales bacterium]|nr:hypothetical protein [Candidatus Gastranaerophilales bacterium]